MAQITITKTIEQGDSITIQANPGENYSFGGWIFDPNQSPVRTNYTYTPNSSDNIEAVFNITDPLVVVCSDKEDTVGRYLYLVNKNDQVKYWYLQTGTNTYTGNDPGWELDNIKTFYGDTYYPRGSKPSVDGKVGANHIISIDAHSLVGVQYLPDTAFFNQKALTSITLPLYLQYVGDGEYCTDGTTYRGVFEGCTSLATVNFGNDYTYSGPLWRLSFIRKIWNWAFGGCTSLTSVSIPTYGISSQNSSNDDLEICANAFSGCTSLSSFTVNNRFNTHRVKSIGNYCFNGCNFTTFNLPNYGGALQSIGINPLMTPICIFLTTRNRRQYATAPFLTASRFRPPLNCCMPKHQWNRSGSGLHRTKMPLPGHLPSWQCSIRCRKCCDLFLPRQCLRSYGVCWLSAHKFLSWGCPAAASGHRWKLPGAGGRRPVHPAAPCIC